MIETKICSKCGLEKELKEYGIIKGKNKQYYKGKCNRCLAEERKEKYKDNEEVKKKNRERAKKYNELHKEEIKEKRKEYFKEYRKKYYEKNKEYFQNYKKTDKYKEQQLQYRIDNNEHIKEQRKKYKESKHDNILEQRKKWDKTYRESHKEERKEYIKTHKERINETKRIYHKQRASSDPLYKFERQIRGVITSSFTRKKYPKKHHTYEIIGLEFDDLYNYLLKTFKDTYGYEWDKKEKVHIDHIIPLSTAKSEQEILELCHYTNLQLLKAEDNLEKSDKLDWNL